MPAAIRLHRAIIAQRSHQFAAALTDLNELVKSDPHHSEALLTLATIQQVRGDYAAARQACRGLLTLESLLLGTICTAQIDGVTGNASAANAVIASVAQQQAENLPPAVREWLYLIHADISQRLVKDNDAETALRNALKQADASPETTIAWLDWLLSQRRYGEVIAASRASVGNDGVLLRLALAEAATNATTALAHIDMLRARFAAAKLRGLISAWSLVSSPSCLAFCRLPLACAILGFIGGSACKRDQRSLA